jgi:peptidoglycan/LPS O-acetylase OafA/YrhL
LQYNPAFDGLRALAALTVVAFHARVPGFSGGFMGVDIFFVLSGYLITRILFEEKLATGAINIRHFFVRRLWRLYPALILLLIAYALLGPVLFPQYPLAKHYQDIVLSGSYLADYAKAFDIPLSVLTHTWSLAVEMHFYLIWPFILLLLFRLPQQRAVQVLAGLWVVLTVWRCVGFYTFDDGWDIYNRTDTHATGLVLGSAIALIKPYSSRALSILGVLLLAFAMHEFMWNTDATVLYGFSLVEIGTAFVIMSPPKWFGHSALAWMGTMSYGLYLWHYPIIRFMRDQDYIWQATLAVGLIGGIWLAVASYYLVEIRLQKRFRPALKPT